MRRWVRGAAALVLLFAVACSSTPSDAASVQVTFIRAVPAANDEFEDVLQTAGFQVGRNLEYLQEDPDGEVHLDPADIRAAVQGWIDEGVDLIVAFSSVGAKVARSVTDDVPILFLVNDPVAVGLLTDPARPDGNLTGVTFRIPADRTLHLARQAIPQLHHLGILVPISDPAGPPARDAMVQAAVELGIDHTIESFRDQDDVARAMGSLHDRGVHAVAVVNAPTSIRFLSSIESVAASLDLPLLANTSLAENAVVVLEPQVDQLLRRLGRQAARLLSGATPADVPVEHPTQFRVILNRDVARQLGLPDFPVDLVRQADLVIG